MLCLTTTSRQTETLREKSERHERPQERGKETLRESVLVRVRAESEREAGGRASERERGRRRERRGSEGVDE